LVAEAHYEASSDRITETVSLGRAEMRYAVG